MGCLVKRFVSVTLVAIAVLAIGIAVWTVRTPARQARWLAEYDATRHYLATADANFDWVVRKRNLNLPTLDSTARHRIETAWFVFGAMAATRDLVRQFDDGHTRARIRPDLWWRGTPDAQAAGASTDEATAPAAAPALNAAMTAAEACRMAGLDAGARPDGWAIPFPQVERAELVDDPEFPAVLIPLRDGRKVAILRVANFGHEHFGPTCERTWAQYRTTLNLPCTGNCFEGFEAAVIREVAARAAGVARDLERRGASAVMVDITENGGGSELADAMARALTARPLHLASGGFIRHPLHVHAFTEMRAAIASDSGHATPAQQELIRRAELRLDSLIAEASVNCHPDTVWSGGTPGCSNTVIAPPLVSYLPPGALAGLSDGWVIWPPAWYGGEEGLYRGRLLVLQDRRSASASEEFAARLRDNDAARIIGSTSYGAGCGHTNGGTTLELPALGLLVSAPDCQRLRMDGSNETEGIAADMAAGWGDHDTPADSARKAIAAIERAMTH